MNAMRTMRSVATLVTLAILVPSVVLAAEMKMKKASVDTACMQTAVETRDNALLASLDTLMGAMKSSFETRRDALKAAWGLADAVQREPAIKAAWQAFKASKQAAVKTGHEAKKAAWTAFKGAVKGTCKAKGNVDGSGEGMDNSAM